MGLTTSPLRVWLNGDLLDRSSWDYDQARAVLSLRGLAHLFSHGAWTSSWEINWE